MHRFETSVIRRHDGDEALVAAGVHWLEGRYFVLLTTAVTFCLCVLVCVGGVLGAVLSSNTSAPYWVALCGGTLAALAYEAAERWGVRERVVIFHLDRIEAPHGLPGRPAPACLDLRITDIANIEAWAGPAGIIPVLYTHRADSYALGLGLNEFQARKVVVELTHARQELIDTLAAPSRPTRARPRVIT
jgi:hypothetical protein